VLLLTPGKRRQSGEGLRLCQTGGRIDAGDVFSIPIRMTGCCLGQQRGIRAMRYWADSISCAGRAACWIHGGCRRGLTARRNMRPDLPVQANNFRDTRPLLLHMFPPWFAGVDFDSIAIGALSPPPLPTLTFWWPAAIMAIASGKYVHAQYQRSSSRPN